MEPYVTADDVAAYLAVHYRTVYRMVANEGLPHRRLNGQLRFKLTDVENWLDSRQAVGQAAVVQIRERGAA